jgi:hypothetical protein
LGSVHVNAVAETPWEITYDENLQLVKAWTRARTKKGTFTGELPRSLSDPYNLSAASNR